MKLRILSSMIALGLAVGVTPSFAHHSTAMYNTAMYKMASPTTVTGVVNTVKPGEVVSCTNGAAKSGDPAMLASLIKLSDGRMITS